MDHKNREQFVEYDYLGSIFVEKKYTFNNVS